jgi:hypothetical protein
MTTTKEAIFDIVSKLDITDDNVWTEDGEPALDIVQKLANDESITRQQINEAAPGFVRHVGEKRPAVNAKAARTASRVDAQAKEDAIVNRDYTDDEIRKILNRRVDDAQEALIAAQKAQSDATQEVARAQKRLERANADRKREFPPVTEAANIKAHLEAQGREAQKRAGIDPDRATKSPIDEVMSRNTRRGTGQTRTNRPVMAGRIVTAA